MAHPLAERFGCDTRLRAAVACLLAGAWIASAGAAEGLSSAGDYRAGKAQAEAKVIADRAACDQHAGNQRDVCRERASGKERVARAELELAHTGTRQARDKLAAVRLDAAYDVARTMCNDKARSERLACAKQAQAARSQGEDALQAQSRRAGRGAAQAQREADYRLDALRCGDMAVDERASCLAAAKARAGRN